MRPTSPSATTLRPASRSTLADSRTPRPRVIRVLLRPTASSTLVRALVCVCLFVGARLAPGASATQSPAAPRYTGSQFGQHIVGMDSRRREQAILAEILSGNVPAFLRTLVPVRLDSRSPDGRARSATLLVMPEYLAIGSDQDFLRIPMNLHTALAVASQMGFVLPTRKIVDAIYAQSAFHFSPEPMTPGPQMRSTEYYRAHNERIEAQSRARGILPGVLVSGHKKDVVISPRLTAHPEKLAIYGWHRPNGEPIQPLSTGAWRLLCRLQPWDPAGQRDGHRRWRGPVDLRHPAMIRIWPALSAMKVRSGIFARSCREKPERRTAGRRRRRHRPPL